MNLALLLKELKLNRTQFIVWALVISGLTIMTMAAMPTMLGNSQNLMNMIDAYPKEFLRAFSFDMTSFQSPLGFSMIYNMIYTMLLGSIFSISVTARMLHREQAERTAEFLLVRPLSRTRIFVSKLAAWLVLLVGMNLVAFASGAGSLALFTPEGMSWSLKDFTVVSLYALLLMLGMGGIGLLVSVVSRRARSLTGPAIGIVLGFYLWDIVAKLTEDYGDIGWVSPFKWVDVEVTRQAYGLEAWRVLAFAALAVSTALAAALVWRRKDMLA